MRENKFEKQVRDKMDELGFTPPDAIWAEVDREINKKEKRRRPLFWIFFLSGLLVAGGFYFISGTRQSGLAKGPELKNQADAGGNKSVPGVEPGAVAETGPVHPSPVLQLVQNPYQEPHHAASHQNNNAKNRATNTGQREADESSTVGRTSAEVNANTAPTAATTAEEKSPAKENDTILTKKASTTDSAVAVAQPEKKQNRKKASWKIGYTATGGISSVSNGFLGSGHQADVQNSSASPSVPPTGGAGFATGTDRSAGFSFGAGVFAAHHLSDRVIVWAGLNYHYYSVKTRIGQQYYFPVNNGNSLQYSTSPFYRNGSSQTIRTNYHFIEIPLALDLQINKSKKNPVYWEFSLSPGYQLSSNALYYDPQVNLYYKNSDLYNQLQVNAGTGFMIGFTQKNLEWQVGPQIQYGLTSLMKNTGSSEHMFYGGIKLVLIPGKK